MSRVLTVRVCDSSGNDLLQATERVDVPLESTFRDVLNDLPGDFADRTLLEVFVREYEGAPDLSSLRLRAGFLEKSLADRLDSATTPQALSRTCDIVCQPAASTRSCSTHCSECLHAPGSCWTGSILQEKDCPAA
jgi:hypothetical protein